MGDEGIAGSAGRSGGDETVEAAGCSQQSSPKGGKVKFFCSHGGKILPRPSDGVLKYVGGETRVVGVPRTISFSDLMKKITELCEGEFVIKYQIGSVDLDALVSVKTDEDLQYMLDEYDRLESTGNPKLRVFLFPATIKVSTNQQQLSPLSIPQSLEQRYLDAINGIVRTSTSPVGLCTRPPMTQSRLRSVCTSPSDSGTPSPLSPSPPSMVAQNSLHNLASVTTTPDPNNIAVNLRGKLTRMHKVHSSPSLCSLGSGTIQSSNTHQLGGGNVQFQRGRVAYPGSLYGHGYHHHHQQLLHQHSTHYHHRSGYRSPGSRGGPSMGREECAGAGVGNFSNHQHGRAGSPTAGFYGFMSRGGYLSPGSGSHNRWAHLGQY